MFRQINTVIVLQFGVCSLQYSNQFSLLSHMWSEENVSCCVFLYRDTRPSIYIYLIFANWWCVISVCVCLKTKIKTCLGVACITKTVMLFFKDLSWFAHFVVKRSVTQIILGALTLSVTFGRHQADRSQTLIGVSFFKISCLCWHIFTWIF